MADARRVIEMVFAGTDELSGTIQTINKSFDDSERSISKVTGPIQSLTENFLKMEAAAVAVGGALATYAVAKAIDLQDAATSLDQVLGDSTRSLDSFKDSAIDLSNQFGIASTSVLDSFQSFSSAGFAADEVEGLTTSLLKFSVASKQDAATATDALVRILKGFNASAADAPAILDTITANTDKYATNVDQLTEALARSAPIAKGSNLTLGETAGILTPIIESFQSAEIASTAFNSVMQRLTSDTKDVQTALEKLGVSQKDANGQLRSGKDILADIQRAYQTLDPSQKLVTANLLSGTEQAAKFALVFDGLEKTTAATRDSLAGVGNAVEERLRKRLEDTSVSLATLRERFTNAAAIIGEAFLPSVNEVSGGLGDLGLSLQEIGRSEGFQSFGDRATRQLAIVGDAIQQFASVLPEALNQVNFTAFFSALDELKISVGDIFSDVDLTTPQGLADVLQRIVDIGTQVIQFNRGLADGLGPAIKLFLDLIEVVSELDPRIAQLAGNLSGIALAVGGVTTALGLAKSAVGVFSGSLALLGSGPASLAVIAGGLGLLATQTKLGQQTLSFWSQAISDFIGGPAKGWTDLLNRATAAMQETKRQQEAEAAQLDVNTVKWETLGKSVSLVGGKFVDLQEHIANVQWRQLEEDVSLIGGKFQALSDSVSSGQNGLQEYLESLREIGGVTRDTSLATDLAVKGFRAQQISVHDTETGLIRYVDAITFAEGATEDLAETQETAAEKAQRLALETEKLEIEWAKLAAQERQIQLQVSADLQIAQLETQAEQFKAVLQTIDTAIESTGETLVGLAKLFIEADKNIFVGGEIRALLEAEEERRRQTFELQKKLIEAQQRYLEVSTDRLARGDALIRIQADGLTPELRLVLDKIIELAHIEASGVAGPLLLGIPSL